MDSSSAHLAVVRAHGITDAEIDAWSHEIRQARQRRERALREALAPRLPQDSLATVELEFSQTLEELNVAEAELRAQCEELASTRLALERERARFTDLFEHAPAPYLVTDPMGTILSANTAAAHLLGADAHRLSGKPLQTFIPLAGRQRFRQALSELAGTHVARELVFAVSPRVGHGRVVSASVNVARDRHVQPIEVRWLLFARGEPNGDGEAAPEPTPESRVVSRTAEFRSLAFERERLLRESEAARRAAEKSGGAAVELLATVSHELRTPISALVSYANLLSTGAHGPLTSQQETDVARMSAALDHVLGLLDNLLLYFRAGAGALPVDPKAVSLRQAVDSAISLVQPILVPKRLNVVIPTDDDVNVLADPDRLRQVLLNLVANAERGSRTGGEIHVSWRKRADNVELDVRDEGAGIPAGLLEQIFEPFFQVEPRANSVGAGFGLGLAISRRLVRAMDGDLTATSVEGSGSTFTLRLRRAP